MTPSTTVSKSDILLAKLTKLIAAQTTGEPSGFSSDELNHAYLSIAKGYVCKDTAVLLAKVLGADWDEGWEPAVTTEELENDATDIALAETLEEIDTEDVQEVVGTLSYALMLACRELGWIESSRAAHDHWFFSAGVANDERLH